MTEPQNHVRLDGEIKNIAFLGRTTKDGHPLQIARLTLIANVSERRGDAKRLLDFQGETIAVGVARIQPRLPGMGDGDEPEGLFPEAAPAPASVSKTDTEAVRSRAWFIERVVGPDKTERHFFVRGDMDEFMCVECAEITERTEGDTDEDIRFAIAEHVCDEPEASVDDPDRPVPDSGDMTYRVRGRDGKERLIEACTRDGEVCRIRCEDCGVDLVAEGTHPQNATVAQVMRDHVCPPLCTRCAALGVLGPEVSGLMLFHGGPTDCGHTDKYPSTTDIAKEINWRSYATRMSDAVRIVLSAPGDKPATRRVREAHEAILDDIGEAFARCQHAAGKDVTTRRTEHFGRDHRIGSYLNPTKGLKAIATEVKKNPDTKSIGTLMLQLLGEAAAIKRIADDETGAINDRHRAEFAAAQAQNDEPTAGEDAEVTVGNEHDPDTVFDADTEIAGDDQGTTEASE